MLNDPLDRPGQQLDAVTNKLMGRLGTIIRHLSNPVTLRDNIQSRLTWWEVIRHLRAARAYPVPPEIMRQHQDLNRLRLLKFRVAYAIATRALVRWGPLYETRSGEYYLGCHQITPDEQRFFAALSDWVDLWADRRGNLRMNYLGGFTYLLPGQSGIHVSQCESAQEVGRSRAGHGRYTLAPVLNHDTVGPVRRSAYDWAAIKGGVLVLDGWGNHSAIGLRPLSFPVSEAEFDARQLPVVV